MKKIFLFVVCMALMMSCGGKNSEGTLVKVGDAVPQFTVEKLDGTQFNIAEHMGEVVWINFWATWCPPCREELTRVQSDIIDHFAGQDFTFIPISRGEDAETVKAFLEENGYGFVPGLDTDESVYGLFASQYIPRNFIIDQDGKVAFFGVGYSAGEFKELIKKAESLLNK